MRFVLELFQAGDGSVTGVLTTSGSPEPQRFSSWLELLTLLERPEDGHGRSQQDVDRPVTGRQTSMRAEIDRLAQINEQIAGAEAAGDVAFLDAVLAPVLAFRRASGAIVNRDQFLRSVAQRPAGRTRIESVELLDDDRAFVRCVVEIGESDQLRSYDNVRLFVRVDGDWKLLGWANAERRP